MKTITATLPTVATTTAPALPKSGAGRYELYRTVHKGLRLFMSEVLVTAGRTDASKEAEVASTVQLVRDLLDMCRVHLHSENQFVHSAMEARRPGSTCVAASEHADHELSFERIEASLRAVEQSSGEARARLLFALYGGLAVFVGENFLHMDEEETVNQAVLWETHTDDELHAIQAAIVASHAPEVNAAMLRWMVPALAPAERAVVVAGLRRAMPEHAFGGLVALVVRNVTAAEEARLRAAFGVAA